MQSGAAGGRARAALRRLLRVVDARVSDPRAGGSRAWRDRVLAEFREGAPGKKGDSRVASTTPEEAESRIRAAEEYASLVHAVHAHKEMLFDYGHSLEKEREQLKKATSTARFVGLDMPEATYDHEKHDAEEAARRAKDPGAASEDEDASAR